MSNRRITGDCGKDLLLWGPRPALEFANPDHDHPARPATCLLSAPGRTSEEGGAPNEHKGQADDDGEKKREWGEDQHKDELPDQADTRSRLEWSRGGQLVDGPGSTRRTRAFLTSAEDVQTK